MTDDDEYDEYKRKMAEIGTPFYRFNDGTFVKAESFADAKRILIATIEAEEEKEKHGWHACTCLGLSHRQGCPVQAAHGVPF
jgi:hypothetical protein|tara:strand:+ start:220 stop:465 length:246 start_codon:yes stop_codon:yes gene_type:complete